MNLSDKLVRIAQTFDADGNHEAADIITDTLRRMAQWGESPSVGDPSMMLDPSTLPQPGNPYQNSYYQQGNPWGNQWGNNQQENPWGNQWGNQQENPWGGQPQPYWNGNQQPQQGPPSSYYNGRPTWNSDGSATQEWQTQPQYIWQDGRYYQMPTYNQQGQRTYGVGGQEQVVSQQDPYKQYYIQYGNYLRHPDSQGNYSQPAPTPPPPTSNPNNVAYQQLKTYGQMSTQEMEDARSGSSNSNILRRKAQALQPNEAYADQWYQEKKINRQDFINKWLQWSNANGGWYYLGDAMNKKGIPAFVISDVTVNMSQQDAKGNGPLPVTNGTFTDANSGQQLSGAQGSDIENQIVQGEQFGFPTIEEIDKNLGNGTPAQQKDWESF